MTLGFFFVRPVPPPEEELNCEVYSETCSSSYEQPNSLSSYTSLLNRNSHSVCVTYRLAPTSKDSLATTNHVCFIFLAQKICHGLDVVLVKQQSPINPIAVLRNYLHVTPTTCEVTLLGSTIIQLNPSSTLSLTIDDNPLSNSRSF